jgi:fused signal recognition particle receptor
VDSALTYLLIAAVIVVLAVVVAIGLVRGRGRGRAAQPGPAVGGADGRRGVVDAVDGTDAVATVAEPVAEPVAVSEAEVEVPGDLGVVDVAEVLEVETPAPSRGRLARLRARLARSNSALGKGLLALLSRDTLDERTWEEVEETLLVADLGVAATGELVDRLRARVRVDSVRDPATVQVLLREELLALVGPDLDRGLRSERHDGRPAVILVVGVNGTGKTTTVGKLGRLLVADGRTVVMGAADTFRAAAAAQLQTWGDRVGAAVVRGPEGGDPAAVAFEAVAVGTAAEVDTVVIDTAGRLHTKVGLMDELGKVKRVAEKHGPVDEVLLVLDATTGQNGMMQARVFAEVVDVTGIVLTKLDGTAKGGIVVSVQRELGVPVKFVGLGEGADDLAPFDAEAFVDALIEM